MVSARICSMKLALKVVAKVAMNALFCCCYSDLLPKSAGRALSVEAGLHGPLKIPWPEMLHFVMDSQMAHNGKVCW